jgi:hypothetical protein
LQSFAYSTVRGLQIGGTDTFPFGGTDTFPLEDYEQRAEKQAEPVA